MLITILDWSGTTCIIIGSVILTTKNIKDKTRLMVFILYFISNILWIPMSLMIGTYGLLAAQIMLFMINVKGIYICQKKIRHERECYEESLNPFPEIDLDDYIDSEEVGQ